MGRTPIRARDSGFVANRCARPFTLESLRMLGEGVAGHEEIDRVCRLGGGFRMGPFELMDLIGVDVNSPSPAPSTSGRRAALAAEPDPGADGRRGPAGPEGRPWLLRLLGGRRTAKPTPTSGPRPLLDPVELEAVGPGGPAILGRIVAQIANEGAFALEEEVASPADIDTAMRLGFNWPAGPLEFAELLGPARAVEILEGLRGSRRRLRAGPRCSPRARGDHSAEGCSMTSST